MLYGYFCLTILLLVEKQDLYFLHTRTIEFQQLKAQNLALRTKTLGWVWDDINTNVNRRSTESKRTLASLFSALERANGRSRVVQRQTKHTSALSVKTIRGFLLGPQPLLCTMCKFLCLITRKLLINISYHHNKYNLFFILF